MGLPLTFSAWYSLIVTLVYVEITQPEHKQFCFWSFGLMSWHSNIIVTLCYILLLFGEWHSLIVTLVYVKITQPEH